MANFGFLEGLGRPAHGPLELLQAGLHEGAGEAVFIGREEIGKARPGGERVAVMHPMHVVVEDEGFTKEGTDKLLAADGSCASVP